MHFGIVAVKADVHELIDAFSTAWPRFERRAAAEVAGLNGFARWAAQHVHAAPAVDWTPDNADIEVYGAFQDGEWAVVLEADFLVLTDDVPALAALSQRFGRVLSMGLATGDSTARFWQMDHGKLSRHVAYDGRAMRTEGERLPQEAGLPTDWFFIDEFAALQRAFGLTPLADLAGKPILATAFIDRTDHGAQRDAARARIAAAAASKR